MGTSARIRLVASCLLMASLATAAAPRIVLDPGHGGDQDGAVSVEGYLEKHLALELCEVLKEELATRLHSEVVLTRGKDVPLALSERVSLVNEQQPELFISVHANSMPTKKERNRVHGIETYFLSANASGAAASLTAARENADAPPRRQADDTLQFILSDLKRTEAHVDSSRLAYAVHQKLVAATGAVDRGVQQAPFYVLTGVEVPAILVEVGFISHPVEGKKLRKPEYQRQLAAAIADGVEDFLRQIGRRAQADSQP